MKIEKARLILQDAKIRVCRHHPRLVLSPLESKVFLSVQSGLSTSSSVAKNVGINISGARVVLGGLFSKGYLKRKRGSGGNQAGGGAPQYEYSVFKWVPDEI